MIESSFFIIVVANWRLDDSKSPAAILQEKAARAPHTLRPLRLLARKKSGTEQRRPKQQGENRRFVNAKSVNPFRTAVPFGDKTT